MTNAHRLCCPIRRLLFHCFGVGSILSTSPNVYGQCRSCRRKLQSMWGWAAQLSLIVRSAVITTFLISASLPLQDFPLCAPLTRSTLFYWHPLIAPLTYIFGLWTDALMIRGCMGPSHFPLFYFIPFLLLTSFSSILHLSSYSAPLFSPPGLEYLDLSGASERFKSGSDQNRDWRHRRSKVDVCTFNQKNLAAGENIYAKWPWHVPEKWKATATLRATLPLTVV